MHRCFVETDVGTQGSDKRTKVAIFTQSILGKPDISGIPTVVSERFFVTHFGLEIVDQVAPLALDYISFFGVRDGAPAVKLCEQPTANERSLTL